MDENPTLEKISWGAVKEFSQYGFDGARIDRIAKNADKQGHDLLSLQEQGRAVQGIRSGDFPSGCNNEREGGFPE